MKLPLVSNKKIVVKRTTAALLSLVLVFSGVTGVYLANKKDTANAVSATDFKDGNIISDSVFYNKNSMNVAQIQNFLNGLIPYCDTWHAGTFKDAGGNIVGAPYVCLNNYYENPNTGETSFEKGGGAFAGGISSAQIIYNAAQDYGINPQVLLVMLKKESLGPLTADNWPTKWQYRYAMGYACPDSGPNNSANCNDKQAGFYKQMNLAAWQFKYYKDHPNDYRYSLGWNNIQYSPNAACGTKRVYIENIATLSLYIYTPYVPNAGALANYPGTSTCGAYGNRNFFMFFNDWFGSTQGTVYNGVNYSPVFDANYYLAKYSDVKAVYGDNTAGAFDHFVTYGMKEGRQGNEKFDVNSYKNRYQDLRLAFENNLPAYYAHFSTTGQVEGRIATGSVTPTNITAYNGIDYSAVYDYSYYLSQYPDLARAFGNGNDAGALKHFVSNGMQEGRQASPNFNLQSYRMRYDDLRSAYGSYLPGFYVHYVQYGKKEGRVATGPIYYGGTTSLNGKDYSSVYNYNWYITHYSDIKSVFGYDDRAALQHFITYGMKEGRQAKESFNVQTYKANYPDLRNAFGSGDLSAYYMHYIGYGQKEGRIAS